MSATKKLPVLCDSGKPEQVLPLCEKYGFGIEIQGFENPNEADNSPGLVKHYKSILPDGIDKYIHAPFWDLCPGSPNGKIAEVTRYYFDYAYEIAEDIGCKGIIVHHGFVPNTSNPANWISRSAVFWQSFFDAHPGDIAIHMENLCEKETQTLAAVAASCKNGRLSVNLDVGHAHCFSGIPATDWVKQLGEQIGYVHIHQNYGKSDEHLGLHKGNVPVKETLELLMEYAPDAVWALECGPADMEKSIEVLSKYGFI